MNVLSSSFFGELTKTQGPWPGSFCILALLEKGATAFDLGASSQVFFPKLQMWSAFQMPCL